MEKCLSTAVNKKILSLKDSKTKRILLDYSTINTQYENLKYEQRLQNISKNMSRESIINVNNNHLNKIPRKINKVK